MCARLVHATGPSAFGPFVPYLGARNEPGDATVLRHQFEQARGGTLFISDVSTLASESQRLLLALLDERALSDVETSAAPGRYAVRMIAGASHHLDRERASGEFCEPLFYRLNIIHIDLIERHAPGMSFHPHASAVPAHAHVI